MNLDSPAGEEMIAAGMHALVMANGGSEIVAYGDARTVLAAALAATVKCSMCERGGQVFVPESTLLALCSFCDGTGQRLAIGEALTE